MNYTLKTAPATEPVTTAEAKAHCRVTHSDEDALFARWITAARLWVEHYTGRALITQTWQMSLPCLYRQMPLPYAAPLGTVTFVKYYDADNALQTWSSTNYITPAFHEPAVIEVLQTADWPSTYLRSDAVQIEYTAGASSVGAVPTALSQAVLLLVSHWNEHREAAAKESIDEVEFAVTALCNPYRIWVPLPC